MEKIKTFELDRWSEPDEQHRVRHIGMADAKETFEKLEAHLKEKGMLPDEYFLYDVSSFSLVPSIFAYRLYPSILFIISASSWYFPVTYP